MQVIIEISEEDFERCKKEFQMRINIMGDAIANGTPLPKHGRLIDADELYGDFIDGTEGYDCQTWNRIEIGEVIDEAPTIIEADDKESD